MTNGRNGKTTSRDGQIADYGRYMMARMAIACATYLAVTGCISTVPPKAASEFDRRCLPASSELRKMPLSDMDRPRSAAEPPDRTAAVQFYSPISVHIADVMDLLPLLNRLAGLEREQAEPADIERIRRKLLARLQLATLEVSSLVAEIECEVHRADEVQDRLKARQSSRTMFQTILGVIFGGLANILSGGIGMAVQAGDAGNITSVAGGVLEVFFGTSANFTKAQQEFSHPHNHLAAFWQGDKENVFFSERVWRFLTQPSIRDTKGHSLRDVMLQAWREEGRLGEPGSAQEKARIELFFGEGGTYSSEDLYAREAMLQQLESSIQLMHQDLETLLREILIRQALEDDQ
ncbi:hypothetical protein [Nitrospira moscoviensis]|uniref:hypothetical protein n=1 Tax=Nitrospira moscoviensis TaxID=42253 RepID=UPI0011AE338E|nr:hypothetical protein [Nitrospira moscoviensis]